MCNAAGQAGEDRREGNDQGVPFRGQGLLTVSSCQMSVSAASTGLALGMVLDMQNISSTVKPFALKPPSHQNARVGMIFLALSKMILLANGAQEIASRLTDRLCLLTQVIRSVSLRLSGHFLGTCLFTCILEEQSGEHFQKQLLMPWIADAPGR